MRNFIPCGLKTLPFYAALAFCLPGAASAAVLEARVGGLVFLSSALLDGPHLEESAATGPLETEVEAGLVLDYFSNVSGGAYTSQGTVFAGGRARADYGVNGAAISVGLRNTNGTDRGAFDAGPLGGGLPFNSSVAPQASAQSSWRDSFVITGGTGLGEAFVSVALHGDAGREAGGTSGLAGEMAFAGFNDHGGGTVQYSLNIFYTHGEPVDFGEDGPLDPVRYQQDFGSLGCCSPPLPSSTPAIEIGVLPDILTGSFLFEYDVPFDLSGLLFVTGQNWITIDYAHTASLDFFDLPDGASISSESGHDWRVLGEQPDPVTGVPEPVTLSLLGAGLAGIGLARRRSLPSRLRRSDPLRQRLRGESHGFAQASVRGGLGRGLIYGFTLPRRH